MGVNVAAFAWGVAEATLFFIVPDVFLTWIALARARAALIACIWATVGALVGGTLMYAWGARDPASALDVLVRIPAISPPMCAEVREQIELQGPASFFIGPLRGVPYKIYAVQAGDLGYGLSLFLVLSIPVRFLRFACVTGFAILICRASNRQPLRMHRALHLAAWFTFYSWYFWVMGI